MENLEVGRGVVSDLIVFYFATLLDSLAMFYSSLVIDEIDDFLMNNSQSFIGEGEKNNNAIDLPIIPQVIRFDLPHVFFMFIVHCCQSALAQTKHSANHRWQ